MVGSSSAEFKMIAMKFLRCQFPYISFKKTFLGGINLKIAVIFKMPTYCCDTCQIVQGAVINRDND